MDSKHMRRCATALVKGNANQNHKKIPLRTD